MSNQKNNTQHLSGSFSDDSQAHEKISSDDQNTPTLSFSSTSDLDVDKVMEDILKHAFFDKGLREVASHPNYILRCDQDYVWLYNLNKHSFSRVSNMSTITCVDAVNEKSSQCVINNELFEVDNDLIECVGWN